MPPEPVPGESVQGYAEQRGGKEMLKILGIVLIVLGGLVLIKVLLGLALAIGALLWFLIKVGVATALVIFGLRLIQKL